MSITLDNVYLNTARQICTERHVRAWLVGGAVRDLLLGIPVGDWDIAIERDAIGAARATANRLNADVYVLDAEHDTARVIAADGTIIDFARLRDDAGGPAGIDLDLTARDFTVNALAIDLHQPDRLIDLFRGQGDLDEGLIRAIAETSLTSDPIRLLRAVRQSASLSFAIEPQTAQWIKTHAALITQASAERVRDELIKLIGGRGCADDVLLLDAFTLLEHVLPEIAALKGVEQSLPHHWNVFEHTRRVVDALELLGTRWLGFDQADQSAVMNEVIPAFAWDALLLTLSPFTDGLRAHLQAYEISAKRSHWHTLKWAALFHDSGKPTTRTVEDSGRTRFFGHEDAGAKLAEARLTALKFSTDEIRRVMTIIGGHMRPHLLSEATVSRRAIYRFFKDTKEVGVDILLLSLADHLATHGPDLDQSRWVGRLGLIEQMLTAYFMRREEIVLPPPLVDGHALMTMLNLKPGKQIGALLEAIREAQAAGEVTTKEEALELAKSVMRTT